MKPNRRGVSGKETETRSNSAASTHATPFLSTKSQKTRSVFSGFCNWGANRMGGNEVLCKGAMPVTNLGLAGRSLKWRGKGWRRVATERDSRDPDQWREDYLAY
jgi:hypothetical protein